MTLPAAADLIRLMERTWPPAATHRLGPVTLREGRGGGNRASAATVESVATADEIAAATGAMRALGQPPLFQVRPGEDTLDALLDAAGFRLHEPVDMMLAPASPPARPAEATYATWPPLAIQRDLWRQAGFGPGRLDVMTRATTPSAALLGRSGDRSAGVAFVALVDDVAFVHAVAVLPAFRRRGVGRALVLRAAAWAAGRGAGWIALAVVQGNAGARALYTSLGFEVVGRYHYRILDADRSDVA